MPLGKFLFFPLINYVVMPPVDRAVSRMAVAELAASSTDGPSALVLEIDGKRVADLGHYRQPTRECFDMGVRSEPAVHLPFGCQRDLRHASATVPGQACHQFWRRSTEPVTGGYLHLAGSMKASHEQAAHSRGSDV